MCGDGPQEPFNLHIIAYAGHDIVQMSLLETIGPSSLDRSSIYLIRLALQFYGLCTRGDRKTEMMHAKSGPPLYNEWGWAARSMGG